MENKAVIFIDKNRTLVRIHRNTWRLLGEPSFVQLLVNPESFTVAIRSAKQGDALIHRINAKKWDNKQSFEIYSRAFVRRLQNLCGGWKDGKAYRLSGEIIRSENMACFDLQKAQEAKNA